MNDTKQITTARGSRRFNPQGPLEQGTWFAVPAIYVKQTLRHAPSHGAGINSFLRAAGIAADLLHDDNKLVPAENYCRLYSLVSQALGDEMAGHGPARVAPGSWAMMCHALITCETLGEALKRFCEFHALFENGFQPRLIAGPHDGCIRIGLPVSTSYTPDFFALELVVFQIHRLMSWLICEYIPFNTLSFSLPRPDHAAWLDTYFVATLLQFDADHTSLTFDARFLRSRVKQDPSTLRRFLEAGLTALFSTHYAPPSWKSRVKALVGRSLPDIPDFTLVAEHFFLHPQTLRRRLAEEGTNFRQIKVEVRREAAMLLMQSSQLSIEEISAKVGFSEPSALTRAFRGWTGLPPQKFRSGNIERP